MDNPVLEAIRTRRAVRSYKPDPVPEDALNTIIEAANQAPSAMNSQPWRFVVVTDKAMRKKMLDAATPNAKKILEPVKDTDPERYAQIMQRWDEMEDPIYYSAPAAVFVIGNGRYADWSCPLACENMMLAARSLGLATCWVAFGSFVTDNDEIVKALELKEDEKIFGPIIIGYAKDYPDAPPKKAPVVKRI